MKTIVMPLLNIKMSLRPLTALAFASLVLSSCAHAPSEPAASSKTPSVIAAWSEFSADETLLARAVVSAPTCPELKYSIGTLDKGIANSLPMKPRGQVSKEFPNLVCEVAIPDGATGLSVLGAALPAKPHSIEKILVIGDTGCRIKRMGHDNMLIQACNDPKSWPFATVADAASAWHPDLVIHVGDYHYREAECPKGNLACEPSPTGDIWQSWLADFFTPARKLLASAPWIFVRGNHELCARAGRGWFQLLDGHSIAEACSDASEPFLVHTEHATLAVIDDANEESILPSLTRVAALQSKNKTPFKHPPWLLLHRPFLTPDPEDAEAKPFAIPAGLQKPGQIGLVMTGHVHRLSLNRFSDQRPPEFISGNSGSLLELAGPDEKATKGVTKTEFKDFGFLTLEHEQNKKGHWRAVAHDRQGAEAVRCQVILRPGKKTNVKCPDQPSPK